MEVLWLAQYPVPEKETYHTVPWITALATQLTQKGVVLTILATGKRLGAPMVEYDLEGFKLVVLDIPGGYIDVFTLFQKRLHIINNYVATVIDEYDVIHVHGTEHQFASALLNFSDSKTPILISIQGLIYQYKKYITDIFSIRRVMWEVGSYYERKEIRKHKNFICRTNWDKSSVLKINSSANIFEIWEIMRPEFYVANTKQLGKNILFSGGNNSLKGLDRCLRVFNKLLKAKEIKLHVLGGASWEYVEKIQKKYALDNINENNVLLDGFLDADKIVELYKDCYCLYHPSLIDNSPNTICEAQLAGLPVIAKDTGGVGSLIKNGITGILLGEDIEEDYEKLNLLDSDLRLQQSIAINARKVAIKRHDVNNIINTVMSTYNTLIDNVA